MNKRKKYLLLIILILLIIYSIPYSGKLYELIIGHKAGGWFWGPSHPEYFEGFFISFMFFVSFFVTFFGGIKKYRNLLIITGIILFFDLFLGAIEELVIDFCFALAGWLLAELGLRALRKVKREC